MGAHLKFKQYRHRRKANHAGYQECISRTVLMDDVTHFVFFSQHTTFSQLKLDGCLGSFKEKSCKIKCLLLVTQNHSANL